MSDYLPGGRCLICDREDLEDTIQVSMGAVHAELCSVECLMVFAANTFTVQRDQAKARIAELESAAEREGPAQCPHCFQPLQ